MNNTPPFDVQPQRLLFPRVIARRPEPNAQQAAILLAGGHVQRAKAIRRSEDMDSYSDTQIQEIWREP